MAASPEERITKVEKEAMHLQAFIERLDASVAKLTEISADVTQLLAVHENRLTFQEKMHQQLEQKADKKFEQHDVRFGKMYDRIEEVKKAIEDELDAAKEEILTKIDENNTKVRTLEKWMWTCLGGGAVFLFALDKVGPVLGIS